MVIRMKEKNPEDAVHHLLGTPFGLEYSDAAQRVRRNLIALSIVAISLVATGAKVKDPEVFGFKLTSASDDVIRTALEFSVLYLVTHFTWHAIELFGEWRLRLTGTRLSYQTGPTYGSNDADYPEDPRQSTLYTWWSKAEPRIGNIRSDMRALEGQLKQYQSDLTSFEPKSTYSPDFLKATGTLQLVAQHTTQMIEKLDAEAEIMSSARIPVSLQRFDDWFHYVNVSQNLRWLFFETTLPIALGIAAILLL